MRDWPGAAAQRACCGVAGGRVGRIIVYWHRGGAAGQPHPPNYFRYLLLLILGNLFRDAGSPCISDLMQ
jgi:hypothetical protein